MDSAQIESSGVGGDLRVRGGGRTAAVPSADSHRRSGEGRGRRWGAGVPLAEYDWRGHRVFDERDVIAIRRAAASGVPLSWIAERYRARVRTIRRIVEWESHRLVGLRDCRNLRRLQARTAARFAVDAGPEPSTSTPDEPRIQIGTDRP